MKLFIISRPGRTDCLPISSLVVPGDALFLDLPGDLALDTAGAEDTQAAVPQAGALYVVPVPGAPPEEAGREAGEQAAQQEAAEG